MSLQDVVGALQASTSADHQTRTVAESRLKELGDLHPRFYEALLEVVALADQAPLEVRIQAILFFKNALDRWRKTCPKSVTVCLHRIRWESSCSGDLREQSHTTASQGCHPTKTLEFAPRKQQHSTCPSALSPSSSC